MIVRRQLNFHLIGRKICTALVSMTVLAAISSVVLCSPAYATRLPEELTKLTATTFPGAKVRLDGGVETQPGEIYLLLVSADKAAKKGKVEVEWALPQGANKPDALFYNNGWAHIRVKKKNEASTLAFPAELPEKLKKKIASYRFPSDLIVPEGFVLPRSFQPFTIDVPHVSLVDDAVFARDDFGLKKSAQAKSNYKGAGTVFLTSVTSGSITMLDGKTLNKLAEFPTEGTPGSMEFANGNLYIADQAKNRVLILDPVAKRFAGQIDLLPRTAPKGIAALPTGKWLYVSESAANDVAVIETATGKVLLKTKVKPGPGRLALTRDGAFLVVLNVTSHEITIISTYNQRVISSVKVGDMPTALVISNDGKTVYVVNRMSSSVSVVDIAKHTVVGTIKTGLSPTAVAISADDSKLYVVAGRENSITEYDTRSLAKLREMHLPVDIEFPGSICLMPDGKRILVTGQQSDSVAVVNVDSFEIEKRTPVGHAHHEALWIPAP